MLLGRRFIGVVAAAACVVGLGMPAGAAASPPNVSAVTYNTPGAFRTDTPYGRGAAASSRGLDVAWSDLKGDVWLERRNTAGVALGPPISVARVSGPGSWSYLRFSVTVGNGFTLITTVRDISRLGFQDDLLAWVVDPGGAVHPVVGTICPSPSPDIAVEMSAAWNGTRFLLAATCETRTETLRVGTDGSASTGPILPSARSVGVASAGTGFLVAYDTKDTADVAVQRLTGAGALAGSPITLAGGAVPRTHPTVAASDGRYLVAWERTDSGPDISARTVSTAGVTGAVRTITAKVGEQVAPSLAPSANGTWLLIWTFAGSGVDVIEGTKVAANGVPTTPDGADLTPAFPTTYHPAFVVRGLPGGATQLFFGATRARRIDAAGAPGATINVTRAPFLHSCFDVAAGPNQSLAVWGETREPGNPNLYGQRYEADGDRIGAVFTISAAPGDQFCPTVAWGSGGWLVTWFDKRTGNTDIYGTRVSTSGTLAPTNGFAISTAPGVQQVPDVSFDGTNFVVVWNDGRNGNQDIFAARVTPGRQVLDPNGIAVTTAAGPQQVPLVASSGGRSLIAWHGNESIDRRLLNGNGTFATGIGTLGAHRLDRERERFAVAASPSAFALVYRELNSSEPRLAIINRTTGNKVRELLPNPSRYDWDGADLTFDGSTFVVASYAEPTSDPRFFGTVQVRSVAPDLMSISGASFPFWLDFRFGLRISGHSGGRSLMVGVRGAITSAVVD